MPCVGNRASVARPANARIRRKGPTQNARGPCTRPRWSAATRGSRVSKPSCARSSRWRTRTLAAADLGLLDPVVYRPRHATDLRQDRLACLSTQSVPALIVEHPPHASFAHFTGKPVRCLAHDAPSCPEVEASGKSGAVRQSGKEIRERFDAVEDQFITARNPASCTGPVPDRWGRIWRQCRSRTSFPASTSTAP